MSDSDNDGQGDDLDLAEETVEDLDAEDDEVGGGVGNVVRTNRTWCVECA